MPFPDSRNPPLRPGHVLQALALLSRLPVSAPTDSRGGGERQDVSDAARAAWAYPVVGLILGALAALAGALGLALGLPAAAAAVLVLGVQVLACGGMHEDGLADTADGLGGGWTRAQRLAIMKDSRIGTYGVLALILALAARWVALWLLLEAGAWQAAAAIVTAAALSRAAMPILMAELPHARDSGLAHHVGTVLRPTAWLGVAIALAAAVLLSGWAGLAAAIWAAAAVLALALLARARLGGQTGDILGATQQAAEVAALFSLIA
ncbi:MAG: adenosylcobinamide-GDP ribazoletransferase [Roseovarius sp.]